MVPSSVQTLPTQLSGRVLRRELLTGLILPSSHRKKLIRRQADQRVAKSPFTRKKESSECCAHMVAQLRLLAVSAGVRWEIIKAPTEYWSSSGDTALLYTTIQSMSLAWKASVR